MSEPSANETYSWEAYLELEAQSETRYEYHDGEIVAMSGATNRHNQLIGNAYVASHLALKGKPCQPFSETVKLFRYRSERYLYPDLMVTCHPLDLQTKNGVRNPLLIMEVLSESNTHQQLAFKLRAYTKLPSLQHYLLVQQAECLVTQYCRNAQGIFELYFYDELEQAISLPEIDLEIPLSTLYDGIEFGPEVSEAEEAAAAYGGE